MKIIKGVKYLTPREASSIIGVDTKTVVRWAKRHFFRYMYLGGRYYIEEISFLDFIRRCEK